MQRILMFCPQLRPLVGGAERQAERLARALTRKGLHVVILTPRLDDRSPGVENEGGVTIHRFPLFDLDNVRFLSRGLGPVNLLSLRLQTIRVVHRYLQESDVVHLHMASVLGAFVAQAAGRRGIPVVCKVATAGGGTDLGAIRRIGLGGPTLVRSLIRHVNQWIAVTEEVGISLRRWHIDPAAITLIPNGVDVMDIPARVRAPSAVAKRFLYLGRLSATANRDIPTLIGAFDRLADQIEDVFLDIVGSGDQSDSVRSLVNLTRHRDRIVMPGLQDPDEYLGRADCFVLPSRQEGLSNALLEAMTYGLACIANDIPANREVLGDGDAGVLVPVGDGETLFEAMRRMAIDPDRARAFGDRARDRVKERFSIETVANRHKDMYELLTEQHPTDPTE